MCRTLLVSILATAAALTGQEVVLPAAAPDPVPQTPEQRLTDVGSIVDGAGLHDVDGELWATGNAFKARFDRGRVLYVPAFGDRTPHNLPARFELLSVGRRGGRQLRAEPVDAAQNGMRAIYDRGVFAETWDVRPEGIELGITLPQPLPGGGGDLVARVRVTTELELEAPASERESLRFGRDGVGSIGIGTVHGIDAAGRSVDGTARMVGDVLELTLPAAFVDAARYPLVLDPLVSTSPWQLGGGSGIYNRNPAVAYDEGTQRYIAAWLRRFSASDYDVVTRLLLSSGRPYGTEGIRNLSPNPGSGTAPEVVNVPMRETFVVVWSESDNVYARGVRSTSGALVTNRLTIANTTDVEVRPDVGSGRTRAEAVVVYENRTRGQIACRRILVRIDDRLSVSGLVHLTSERRPEGYPSISTTSEDTGRFLVAFHRNNRGEFAVLGIVISESLQVISGEHVIGYSGARANVDPAVDGDGTGWVVAWERQEPSGSGKMDIVCRSLAFDETAGTGYLLSDVREVAAGFNDDARDPDVCWVGGSVLIAHEDQDSSSNWDTHIASFDPFRCTACELAVALQTSGSSGDVAMARRKSSLSSWEALVVWESVVPSQSAVLANVYRADDGLEALPGSGCGAGGEARATCARLDRALFEHTLRNARPNATAALVISLDWINVPCGIGQCALMPNPISGVALFTTTDAHGRARVPMSLPNVPLLRSIPLYEQWLVAPGSPSGCTALGIDLSSWFSLQVQ